MEEPGKPLYSGRFNSRGDSPGWAAGEIQEEGEEKAPWLAAREGSLDRWATPERAV
jgi:hypothetical protein